MERKERWNEIVATLLDIMGAEDVTMATKNKHQPLF